jgi:hypothetical protein
MGYGGYSLEAHEAITRSRADRPASAVFTSTTCPPSMNPLGVVARECRDSDLHPRSVGVVFALDVSGSMEAIPEQLATRTLPTFMKLTGQYLDDPQLLFLAFGNAYSDQSPLQVGQFESEAPLIDHWLSTCHLEGKGGGLGESYDLAMYFCARHTVMDCLKKRSKKGYFFMTGDEVPFTHVHPPQVQGLIGGAVDARILIADLTIELQRSFDVFFLIPDRERAARYECEAVWKLLLDRRCVVLETPDDTALVAAVLIGISEGRLRDVSAVEAGVAALGIPGDVTRRVARTVTPFLEGFLAGTLQPPRQPGTRTDNPNIGG